MAHMLTPHTIIVLPISNLPIRVQQLCQRQQLRVRQPPHRVKLRRRRPPVPRCAAPRCSPRGRRDLWACSRSSLAAATDGNGHGTTEQTCFQASVMGKTSGSTQSAGPQPPRRQAPWLERERKRAPQPAWQHAGFRAWQCRRARQHARQRMQELRRPLSLTSRGGRWRRELRRPGPLTRTSCRAAAASGRAAPRRVRRLRRRRPAPRYALLPRLLGTLCFLRRAAASTQRSNCARMWHLWTCYLYVCQQIGKSGAGGGMEARAAAAARPPTDLACSSCASSSCVCFDITPRAAAVPAAAAQSPAAAPSRPAATSMAAGSSVRCASLLLPHSTATCDPTASAAGSSLRFASPSCCFHTAQQLCACGTDGRALCVFASRLWLRLWLWAATAGCEAAM